MGRSPGQTSSNCKQVSGARSTPPSVATLPLAPLAYDDRCWATLNGSGSWSRCADAESMRTTLETMRICPEELCDTR